MLIRTQTRDASSGRIFFLTETSRQIMDPKMDSGSLGPGEQLDEDYDVSRPLLPAEVIGIIDQLLCLEVCS